MWPFQTLFQNHAEGRQKASRYTPVSLTCDTELLYTTETLLAHFFECQQTLQGSRPIADCKFPTINVYTPLIMQS